MGNPISEMDTPAQLEMEEKDILGSVLQQQTGGVYETVSVYEQ